jgi:hypothetical protein
MTKQQKFNRTQIKDLLAAEKALTKAEAAQIKGGGAKYICIRCGKVDVDNNPCCPPPSKPN